MDDKTKNTTTSAPAGAVKTNTPENKKPNSLKTKLPLIIAIVILLIGIGVALFFILRKPAEDPNAVEDEDDENTVIVYEPPEGSEDPGADYIIHHQSIVSSPDSTDEEKFDSLMSIANAYISSEELEEAESLLNDIDRESLTNRQRYDLYNRYVYLFETKGDTVSEEQYSNLAEEALFAVWEEEEPEAQSSEEGGTATEE